MLFPTIRFAVFFIVVFTGSWALGGRPRLWRLFILVASYFFYGMWDWRFIGLIVASTLFNQALALGIARTARAVARKRLLVLAVGGNLLALGFFKYYGFLITSVAEAFRSLGLSPNLPLLEIILPVGVSFFTFQALSYVIDVYRKTISPAPTLDFAVYLAFFPQLVAGPIVRGSEFLPQLRADRDPTRIDAGRGFALIAGGLVKKVVVADLLASTLVDPVFASPQAYSGLMVLMAIYGYSLQIYADFSAYSDIAVGVALLLGFRFPQNFNAPYAATSIRDFWRRWHMTLSRWLRDYLYVGLGGNRGGRIATYRNLLITMLLGGLWHGAAWRFVFWGAFHGLLLGVERAWSDIRLRAGRPPVRSTALLRFGQRLVTFHLVSLGWVFFRADSVGTATTMLGRIVSEWSLIAPGLTLGAVAVIAITLATQFLPRSASERLLVRFTHLPALAQAALLAFVLVIVDALGPDGVAAFIYFQF